MATSVPSVNKMALEFMPPNQLNSFYLYPTTPEEIEEEIGKSNPSKATGPYSIRTRIKAIRNYIQCFSINWHCP